MCAAARTNSGGCQSKPLSSFCRTVHVLPPVVGDDDDETSFAVHLGKFDALIDTMGNESSDTVNLLKSEHDCGM